MICGEEMCVKNVQDLIVQPINMEELKDENKRSIDQFIRLRVDNS